MPTGVEIRERMEKRGLVFLGKATALAGAPGQLVDTVRLRRGNDDPGRFGNAFVRLTTTRRGTATSITATTLVDATAPFVASAGAGTGLIGAIVCIGNVYGTVTSNTTTTLTLAAGWFSATGAAAVTPVILDEARYYVDWGFVAKVERVDPATGILYFNPTDTGAPVPLGTDYEVWLNGVEPDKVDRARDRAGADRCTRWQKKPLSLLPDVSEWTQAIVSTERAAPTALDFPAEFYERSLRIYPNGAGANAGIASPVVQGQPSQQYVVFGFVRHTTGFAESSFVEPYDMSNSVAIADLQGVSRFQGGGFQFFVVRFALPSNCEAFRINLKQTAVGGFHEWAGVGVLQVKAQRLSLPSAVWNDDDVGEFYYIPTAGGAAQSAVAIQDVRPVQLPGVARDTAGDGVVITLPGPAAGWPIYYEEARRFSALQSDYMTPAGRALGDYANTTARLRYIEAVTVSELLEAWPDQGGPLAAVYAGAEKDASAYDYRDGAKPRVVEEPRQPRAIPWMRL